MNAERLHAIANALAEELAATQATTVVRQLATALQQSATDPNQQAAASTARSELERTLPEAPTNDFSPAWRQALEELGVADIVGSQLLAQIEEIVSRNDITPAAAGQELTPIADRIDGLNNAVEQARAALSYFEIGAEVLAPGEVEVGFVIPRPAVDDELEELGDHETTYGCARSRRRTSRSSCTLCRPWR